MIKSKLTKRLGMVSDYFFGIGDNNHYKDEEYFLRSFGERPYINQRISDLRLDKKLKILVINAINVLGGLTVYQYFKTGDPFWFHILPFFEIPRFMSFCSDKIGKHEFLNRKKSILSQLKHQTLEEIQEDLDKKQRLRQKNSEGEEWKYFN